LAVTEKNPGGSRPFSVSEVWVFVDDDVVVVAAEQDSPARDVLLVGFCLAFRDSFLWPLAGAFLIKAVSVFPDDVVGR